MEKMIYHSFFHSISGYHINFSRTEDIHHAILTSIHLCHYQFSKTMITFRVDFYYNNFWI